MNTILQSFWQGLRWLIRKLLFLITLVLVSAGVLMLGSGLNWAPTASGAPRFYWDPAQWWHVLTGHLAHVMRGQLVPPRPATAYGLSPLQSLPSDLLATVPVTLKLVGTAFVISLIVGLLLGLLLSVFAPAWLRAPLWSITTTLHSVPDLVLACLLDLAVVLITIARGGVGPTQGSMTWQKYVAPSIALALLVVPYIARLTAAAIDEVSVQEFIRAAVARGVHPGRVLFVHIGKNVLIHVSTALPVVASLLVSGSAIIEYFAEVHGAGRAMLIAVSQPGDGYEASVYLVPLLVVFTFVLALADGGQRLLDPRLSGELVAATQHGDGERVTWRDRVEALRPGRLWGALREFAVGAAFGIREGIVNLPGAVRRWGRALKDPVLLAGVVGVAALAAVAVLAPRIAAFDPLYRSPIFTDRAGLLHVPPFLPDQVHRLGTDDLGRDVFSRLIYGTRYALLFALLVVPARFGLAAVTGMLAAFRGC
ncbi:MAG: transporter permease, partial [Firmicutes bacterium]|nr:transporter permease [Bacillota bacterium]